MEKINAKASTQQMQCAACHANVTEQARRNATVATLNHDLILAEPCRNLRITFGIYCFHKARWPDSGKKHLAKNARTNAKHH